MYVRTMAYHSRLDFVFFISSSHLSLLYPAKPAERAACMCVCIEVGPAQRACLLVCATAR